MTAEPDTGEVAYVPVDDLAGRPHPENPKAHDLDTLTASIRRFGFAEPVVRDERTGLTLSGHGRVEALQAMRDAGEHPPAGVSAEWGVPVYTGWASRSDDEASAALVALNRVGETGGWHEQALAGLLERLAEAEAGLEGVGYGEADLLDLRERLGELDREEAAEARDSLAERFGAPPVSVLDARGGRWRDRKRAWLALGIRSELGRGELLAYKGQDSLDTLQGDAAGGGLTLNSASGADPGFYEQKRRAESLLGRDLDTDEFVARYYVPPGGPGNLSTTGTSVFDPVLCELMYRWFAPPQGGRVLDPFAGGSVRGVVAAWLGLDYVGVDLRPEQVEANTVQAAEILPEGTVPDWRVGDATDLSAVIGDALFDLVFTCPPYWNLEQYGDDPADLSNAETYDDFRHLHRTAIRQAARRAAPGAFVVWVVGEVRDARGGYCGLVPDTVHGFLSEGLAYYNELSLVTPMGSVPVRAGRQMTASRKVGKTHQNVVVFYNGDPREAASGWGEPSGVELPEQDDPLAGDDVTVHEP